MSNTRRPLRLALATFTTTALIALLVMPFADGTASASSVSPETVEGNPTCGDFTDGGIELKIEGSGELTTGDSGQYTDGRLIVDLTLRMTDDGPVFDWTSNFGVDVVVAKGGPIANVYRYQPIATSDSSLHAPLNQSSGEWYGLSHISFCYVEKHITTTTSTTCETTTTASETTTTWAKTTTTLETTTTTSGALETTTTASADTTTSSAEVLPTHITATTAPATSTTSGMTTTTSTIVAETLPFTGLFSPTMWVFAVSLLGAGVSALLIARGRYEDVTEDD